jgi:ATP-binding cassette, subfamily B, bacterial
MSNEELYEEESFTSTKLDINVWKKIFSYMEPTKKYVLLSILCMLVLAGTDVTYPYIAKFAIDNIITPNVTLGNVDWTRIYQFIALYLGFMIVQAIMVYIFILFAGKVQTELAYGIRKKAFHHLQELPFSYYDRTRVGWIMARMTSDSRNLSEILSWGVIDLTWGLFMMVILTVVMFIINWKLAIITLAIVPFLVLISIFFSKYILKSYRSIRKVNSKITGSFNEGITGAITTKTLVLEQPNFRDFDQLTTDMRKQSIRAAVFQGLYFPTIIFLIAIGTAMIYLAGGTMVLNPTFRIGPIMLGTISIGTLYLYTSYVGQFFDPVNNVATIFARFQQAQASAERIVSLIETKPDIIDAPEVVAKYGTLFDYKRENFETLKGDVEFRDVTFKYQVGEAVLTHFNLKVKAGESIALVGHTGAGKSTIVNLICRFYEPTGGQVLVDGIDYRERSMGWLHSNLGYVLQTPHLFSGTVLENIRYGKLTATDDECIAAAKSVSAHEFIMKFEKGYETECGERGSRLSVGQKQLISFARAILADPKILVLDEATSSVDTETERAIQLAIHKLLDGRTSFIVAHRLSTIVGASRILVLEQGEVIESGTHRELILKKGHYYHLYTNQYTEEMLEQSKH